MYSVLSKTISFVLAMVLSGLILLIPQAMTHQDNTVNHPLLMLLMIGVMIGFIHGVGFRAKSIIITYIISPFLAWPIMFTGILMIIEKVGALL